MLASISSLASGISRVAIATQANASAARSAIKLNLLSPATATSPCSVMSRAALSTTPALEWHKKSWRGNGYGHHGGPWLCLFNPDHGRRSSFPLAHQRFKRLDWGIYIRPRAGRAKKHWQKTAEQNWKNEQHIFCTRFHVRRLERMFAPEVKEPRHLIEDPYHKYNRFSFDKHRYTKAKNLENVRRYGSKVHLFDRWKAHLSKSTSRYNRLEKEVYEPPGYAGNVADSGGNVYTEEFVPSDTPAPHFARKPIRINKSMRDRSLIQIKKWEQFYGKIDPWNPLLHKAYFRDV